MEDAVKYVIFLVDANKLFDTALGMYDFALVLMIAQHAQKVWQNTFSLRLLTDWFGAFFLGPEGVPAFPP